MLKAFRIRFNHKRDFMSFKSKIRRYFSLAISSDTSLIDELKEQGVYVKDYTVAAEFENSIVIYLLTNESNVLDIIKRKINKIDNIEDLTELIYGKQVV